MRFWLCSWVSVGCLFGDDRRTARLPEAVGGHHLDAAGAVGQRHAVEVLRGGCRDPFVVQRLLVAVEPLGVGIEGLETLCLAALHAVDEELDAPRGVAGPDVGHGVAGELGRLPPVVRRHGGQSVCAGAAPVARIRGRDGRAWV